MRHITPASTPPSTPPERPGRALIPLGLVFLAVGISTAVAVPFLALFLNTAVHAGPVQVTVFLVAAPLAGVVVATLVGRVSDRRPIRRALLIGASLAGVVGTGLAAFVRDYWILLAATVTATAFAGTLFPQALAYAREVLDRAGSDRAAMSVSALRTLFSLAWVAGPPLAAVLLDTGGFAAVYAMAAGMYGLAALAAFVLPGEVEAPTAARPDEPPITVPAASRWRLRLTAAAFTLMQCPLTLGVQALPLFIGTDLHGKVSDAGLVLGLCALLEIPLMLGLGWLTTRVRLRALVLAGAACGVGYEVLAATASTVGVLAAGQVLDAVFIAAVSSLGITYVQDMLPGQPGRATTLFTNSFPVGAMLAGPLFGLAQHFGFRSAYVMAAALCAAGLLLLLLVRPRGAAGMRPRLP